MRLIGRCAPLLALLSILSPPPPSAWADLVYKTWTIKNTSAETADDLHVVVSNRMGTLVEPVSKARSQAFDDPPKGEGTATLDWPKTGGGGTVPPGFSDLVSICNEDQDFLIFQTSNTYFTSGGKRLATGYVTHTWTWDVDQDGSVTFNYANPASLDQGNILVKRLEIYGANSLQQYQIDDLAFPYATPSGSLLASADLVSLSPGQAASPIPLNIVDISSSYLLMLATVAPVADLSDEYFIAGGFTTVPEPTLATLTLSALALLAGGIRLPRSQPIGLAISRRTSSANRLVSKGRSS
jgi:hypothetical protein